VTGAAALAISPDGPGTGAWCDNTAHSCGATQAGTYNVTAGLKRRMTPRKAGI
jgi:hypothetical protein